jgi:hypothetical protein
VIFLTSTSKRLCPKTQGQSKTCLTLLKDEKCLAHR